MKVLGSITTIDYTRFLSEIKVSPKPIFFNTEMTKVWSNESKAFSISIVIKDLTENVSDLNDVCYQYTVFSNKSVFVEHVLCKFLTHVYSDILHWYKVFCDKIYVRK